MMLLTLFQILLYFFKQFILFDLKRHIPGFSERIDIPIQFWEIDAEWSFFLIFVSPFFIFALLFY